MSKTKSARTAATVASPSTQSIEMGTKILRTAIKTKTSASEASRNLNRGKNYISNLNAKLMHLLRRRLITKEEYNTFKELYSKYQATIN